MLYPLSYEGRDGVRLAPALSLATTVADNGQGIAGSVPAQW